MPTPADTTLEPIEMVGPPVPYSEPLLPNDSFFRKLDLRLVALFLAGFSTFIDLYATQPILPLLTRLFGATASAVSMTVSATTTAVALSAPFIGMAADRLGRKHIITGAILLLTLPTALAATSQNLGQLVAWRFLQGLCLPGIIAVTMAYISEEWSGRGAGQAMSCYVSGTVLGGFCGRFITGLIATNGAWREAFLVLAAINLVGGVVVLRALPNSKRFVPQAGFRRGLRSMFGHMRNPALLAVYAVAFSVLFCLVAAFNYIGFHLHAKPYFFSSAAIGSIFFVYLLGVVVTPLAGRMIDRIGSRAMLVVGLSTSCAGALLTLLPPVWAILVGLALFSSGIFICQTAGSNRVGEVAKGARSAAAGLYVTLYYLGGTFGASMGGIFWSIGNWPAVVGLIACVEATAATFAFVFWRERGPAKSRA